MREEGIEAVWTRHARVAEMIRAGVDALGLKFLAAEGYRSNTVTAIHNPVDGPDTLKELLTALRTRHGLVLAGGQGDLAGRIFRIGHLGMIEEGDVYSILATLEQGLHESGMRSRIGLAVPAAQAVVRSVQVSGQPAGVG
jgi:aspartate aminotransferase-like enzyme